MQEKIIIKGAREHNLKNINLELPRNKFIVITGLSGSGKSSLAFDTIYAEGQRRYVESLSAYARQFLGQMEKPDVDYIEGLSPAISIEQKTVGKNPRSTVGTITEIYDYLRLFYARCGIPHCWICGNPITSQSIDQIIDEILRFQEDTKLQILAPIARGKKGEYKKELDNIKKEGFVRVRIDGNVYNINDEIKLEKNIKHTIEIIVDRIVLKEGIRERLADSIETSLKMADGIVNIIYHMPEQEQKEKIFSEKFACINCGVSIEEIQPRLFSFNSPHGACLECHGIGVKNEFDPDLIIPEPDISILDGAIKIAGQNIASANWAKTQFEALANKYKFKLDVPVKDLPKKVIDLILYGSTDDIDYHYESKDGRSIIDFKRKFEGLIPTSERRFKETTSEEAKNHYMKFMSQKDCPVCKGQRLKPEALAVKIDDKSIIDLTKFSVKQALTFFNDIKLDKTREIISEKILKEIKNRLSFLDSVGVGYLSLDRKAATLSGGESQRIRLATQIGSSLVGVLYVLDEPTIGLHQKDNTKLIDTLIRLRDIGNTLIVVEHDDQTIRSADYIVDLGPGAGIHGGDIVACGTLNEILNNPASLTGKYLKSEIKIELPDKKRSKNENRLTVYGARKNNLKNIDVSFPLGKFISITGVSGSGKSSLVNEVLYNALRNKVYRSKTDISGFDRIEGFEHIDKVIDIDQSPIGRTPRSNPATYTGVFGPIRDLFAGLPESKMRGYKAGRFSFNVKGGRCENCQGDGQLQIEMHFLPDVYITCDVCKGKRYNQETLQVRYKGKSIADVLEMTVEEAEGFFENIPQVNNKLKTLCDVGLDYIRLGQSATTLSGGEAQRIKLASELSKKSTGKTFYLLDEPTTGLHFEDVKKLITVLNSLVNKGNTVLVIEHNLDVIKSSDYIIDLGPEGGDEGGSIIFEGPVKDILKCKKSYTGQFLKTVLNNQTVMITGE